MMEDVYKNFELKRQTEIKITKDIRVLIIHQN